MEIAHVSDLVKLILLVNTGALLVLAPVSYFFSRWALNRLAAVERWLNKAPPEERRDPSTEDSPNRSN